MDQSTPEGSPGSSLPVASIADKFLPAASPRTQSAGPEKLKSSSIQLASDVVKVLTAAKEDENLSPGEYIIRAIETTATDETIIKFLHPHGSVGGTLFARREVQGPRASDPLDTATSHAVAVKLFPSDFKIIDTLIGDLNARSRPHLINAAVRAYDNRTKVEEK